jgi:hypothetical protein
VRYKNQIYKLILTGAISTFFIEHDRNLYLSNPGYSKYFVFPRTDTYEKDKLYFFDLKTGKIDILNRSKIERIIRRDGMLFASFSNISKSKQKKILYSYILKYNLSHPIYIKLENNFSDDVNDSKIEFFNE